MLVKIKHSLPNFGKMLAHFLQYFARCWQFAYISFENWHLITLILQKHFMLSQNWKSIFSQRYYLPYMYIQGLSHILILRFSQNPRSTAWVCLFRFDPTLPVGVGRALHRLQKFRKFCQNVAEFLLNVDQIVSGFFQNATVKSRIWENLKIPRARCRAVPQGSRLLDFLNSASSAAWLI